VAPTSGGSDEGDVGSFAPTVTLRHDGAPGPTRGGMEPVRGGGDGELWWKNKGKPAVALTGGKTDSGRANKWYGGSHKYAHNPGLLDTAGRGVLVHE
jgi:hypothetical protein